MPVAANSQKVPQQQLQLTEMSQTFTHHSWDFLV